MYMIIMFKMQMIYMYHVLDLLSENLVSKLLEWICVIPFQVC